MKYLVFIVGISVGLFLILSDPNPDSLNPLVKEQRSVGSATKPYDRFFVRRSGELRDVRVTRELPIRDLDTWETGENGLGSLKFNNGAVITLDGNSRIIIDDLKNENKIEVTVLQGDVNYIREVSDDRFEIIKLPVGGIESKKSEILIKLPNQTYTLSQWS